MAECSSFLKNTDICEYSSKCPIDKAVETDERDVFEPEPDGDDDDDDDDEPDAIE